MSIRNVALFSAAVIVACSLWAIAKDKKDTPATQPAKSDAAVKTASGKSLDTVAAKASYFIGYRQGMALKQQGLGKEDLDIKAFVSGVADALAGEQMTMTNEELQATFKAFQEQVEKRRGALADANLKAGEVFLAKNAKREGVKTTDSGLQYEVIRKGDGPKPAATDEVKVHYHGTLIDGTVFDSSVDRGEPVTFPLDGVIPGWTEGVQLMPVGSKYKLYVPADLAYGESPGGPGGPNSALIFEVELLDIVKAGASDG